MATNFLSRKDVQARFSEVGDSDRNLLYTDKYVIIDSEIVWDNGTPGLVDSITLHLKNSGFSTANFGLCELSDCVHPTYNVRYILIHMRESTSPINPTSHTINFNLSPLSLMKGESILFLFKIYGSTCPNQADINCELDGIEPESKDGSIIISI